MTDVDPTPPSATVESWRRAFAARSADAEPAERPAVDPETIWRAVRGELPADETRALVDRMVDDPELALEWRLARELVHASETGATETGPSESDSTVVAFPDRATWTRRATPWVAIAAVLVVAVVALLLRPPEPTTPVWRAGGASIESRVDADRPLPRADAILRWSGPTLDGASATVRWSVDVLTESLEPVTSASDLGEPSLRLEPSTLADLDDGTVLLWRVTAYVATADGVDEVASPTFRTVLGSHELGPTEPDSRQTGPDATDPQPVEIE